MKHRQVWVLVGMLVFVMLAGCGSNADKPGGGEEILLSVLGGLSATGMTQGVQNNAIMDEIAKKTGVRLELNEQSTGTLHEQLVLQLAADDLMDVTIGAEMDPLIRAGKAVDLEPLIEKVGPNVKANLETFFPVWRVMYNPLNDNKLYALWSLTVRDNMKKPAMEPSLGLGIRYDLLKQLGLPQIETTEDWYNVMKQMKEQFPTVDGRDAYPYATFLGEDWSIFWSLLSPFHLGQGLYEFNGTYFRDDGVNVLIGSREDTLVYENAMRFFNRLYKEGLFDPQSFEMSFDQLNDKIKAGRVYSFSCFAGMTDDAETYWKSKPETSEWTFAYPNVHTAGYTGETVWDISTLEGVGRDNITITTANKYPEETMKLFDFLASDEGQLLCGRGIEGTHYDVDANGRYVMKADVMEQFKTNENYAGESGVGAYGLLARLDALNPAGQSMWWNLDPETKIEQYSPAQREAYAWLGQTLKGDTLVHEAKNLKYLAWLSAVEYPEFIGQVFSQVFVATVNTVPKAIMAKTEEEFQKVMEDHYKELDNIGADRIREFMQNEYDARIDLINELKQR